MHLPANSLHPATRAEWRAWLEAHAMRREGLWLVIWKKASGNTPLAYDDIVEEALAFGWVDSKTNGLDEHRSMLWLAPRKPGSLWSRPNKERVQRLQAAGLMAAAGQAKVDAARSDGTWSALDGVEALEVPDDLRQALARHPNAARHFNAFPRSAKRGILEWVLQAKRADTRARRIEETARLAEHNVRANQWQRKDPPKP
ncbi:MAG TPA: YdeI/OmpD-associated family protein [Rubrivivax sp.]|nr:YdeI/OmpD-associated family protein [Rubrivivax sp.]